MKRLVTVQDISCVGKCSLTVALPVISAMGVETCILPTAVLSAHTLFPHPVITDLTDQILPTITHWKEQGITFDAIYTGYLADSRQIDLVIRLIREFGAPGVPVIVDPAMADNGTLYAGFSDEFPMEMLHLCRHADIILPNITEAALMTGIEYRKDGGEAYLKELLLALSDRLESITSYLILTGASLIPGQTGILGLERQSGRIFQIQQPKIPAVFHGTGDLFASTFTGGLVRGLSVEHALSLACEFTARAIQATVADPHARTYGVNFEEALPWLTEQL